MTKLKTTKHNEKNVSINEFVYLVTGILNLDDFHRYSQIDIQYVEKELRLAQRSYLHKHYPEKVKNPVDQDESQSSLISECNSLKRYTVEGVPVRLECLSLEEKHEVWELSQIMRDQWVNNRGNFVPHHPTIKSQTDGNSAVFNFKMLCQWLFDSIDLTNVPITSYITDTILPTFEDHSSAVNDALTCKEGCVKNKKLPKLVQLMVNSCNKPEFDKNHPSYNEDTAKENLDLLAKKMNIYMGNNQRTVKGLANINCEKVISFIQKDKN